MPTRQGVMPPPAGVTPNFDYSNPWLFMQSRAIIIAGLVFATLFLGLRLYTKTYLLRKFGWDDVSLLVAFAWSIATQAMCFYGYQYGGIGIHIWNITPEMFQSFQKGVFISGVVYVPALAFAKASLIILYYRIVGQQKIYRWCIYILSFVVGGYSIGITLALIFACNPLAKSWDKSITEGHCVDQNGLYIATAVTNTVTDVALLVLPMPMVFTLNMPTVQKFGLSLVFLVGCATVVTSVIRLVTLFPFLQSTDPTYKIAWTDLWINVEANFIIICNCLPFLRQFCRRYAPRFIGEGSTQGLRYFTGGGYHDDSTSRSRARRKPGLTLLQEDVELADGGGTQSQIIKEVHWNVTTEYADESPNAGMKDQHRQFQSRI